MAEKDHPAADALVWCSMKMIAVQRIIYDVYLVRTGNCDIGTSHECKSVEPWDWNNMVCNAIAPLHGAIVKITENRVIVNTLAADVIIGNIQNFPIVGADVTICNIH